MCPMSATGTLHPTMGKGVLARVGRLLISGLLCVAAGACGVGGVPDHGWAATEDQLLSAIVSSTEYPPESIEVLASAALVNVSISDRKLARADDDSRERVANVVLTAVERTIADNSRLSAVEEVRIVIVHPAAAQGLLGSTHTEDVLEFKRGPDRQFYRDVL